MTDLEALREKVAAGDVPWLHIYEAKNNLVTNAVGQGKERPLTYQAYEGSTDAAIALVEAVLPDWEFQLTSYSKMACVYLPWPNSDSHSHEVQSGTLARALLLATLDALIAKEKNDDI